MSWLQKRSIGTRLINPDVFVPQPHGSNSHYNTAAIAGVRIIIVVVVVVAVVVTATRIICSGRLGRVISRCRCCRGLDTGDTLPIAGELHAAYISAGGNGLACIRHTAVSRWSCRGVLSVNKIGDDKECVTVVGTIRQCIDFNGGDAAFCRHVQAFSEQEWYR